MIKYTLTLHGPKEYHLWLKLQEEVDRMVINKDVFNQIMGKIEVRVLKGGGNRFKDALDLLLYLIGRLPIIDRKIIRIAIDPGKTFGVVVVIGDRIFLGKSYHNEEQLSCLLELLRRYFKDYDIEIYVGNGIGRDKVITLLSSMKLPHDKISLVDEEEASQIYTTYNIRDKNVYSAFKILLKALQDRCLWGVM